MSAASHDTTTETAPLGANINSLADYNGNYIMADAMKQSRTWKQSDSDDRASADEKGWPLEDAKITVWSGGKERYTNDLNGDYALSFTGKADITVPNYTGASKNNVNYDEGANTTTATITAPYSGKSNLKLKFTNTQRNDGSGKNGITDVKLMRPVSPGSSETHDPSELFTRKAIEYYKQFAPLRAMDYSQTNNNEQDSWSDRTVPSYYTQSVSGIGASWEYLIEFANETSSDLWINIPHKVGDSYVRKLAKLIKYGSDGEQPYDSSQSNPDYPPLDSGLKLYVEYSNEVWNSSFEQYHYNMEHAQTEASNGSPINYDDIYNPNNDNPEYTLGWRRITKRLVEISDVFRDVWGDSAMGDRVRPLLEWKYTASGVNKPLVAFLEDYYNNPDQVSDPKPPSYYVWGGGPAWYGESKNEGGDTVDAVYNSGITDITGRIHNGVSLSRAYGLKTVGYEGGFRVGGDPPITDTQYQANLDSRAKNAVKTQTTEYFEAGGDLPVIFLGVGANAYGIANPSIYDTDRPKVNGYQEIMSSAAPAPTNYPSAPKTIDATEYDIRSLGYKDRPSDNVDISAGEWVSFTVDVGSSGDYEVGTNKDGNNGVELVVDGEREGSGPATVSLDPGLHGVRVNNVGSDTLYDVKTVRVQSSAIPAKSEWTASTNGGTPGGFGAVENAVDGDTDTRFYSTTPEAGTTLAIDMGSPGTISELEMPRSSEHHRHANGFAVEVSDDGTSWTQVASGTDSYSGVTVSFDQVSTRHVRVRLTEAPAKDDYWAVEEVYLR